MAGLDPKPEKPIIYKLYVGGRKYYVDDTLFDRVPLFRDLKERDNIIIDRHYDEFEAVLDFVYHKKYDMAHNEGYTYYGFDVSIYNEDAQDKRALKNNYEFLSKIQLELTSISFTYIGYLNNEAENGETVREFIKRNTHCSDSTIKQFEDWDIRLNYRFTHVDDHPGMCRCDICRHNNEFVQQIITTQYKIERQVKANEEARDETLKDITILVDRINKRNL